MADFSNISDYTLLLKKFNNRDSFAIGQVYNLLYNELFYFTAKIYIDTDIVASDVIHDVFIKLLETRSYNFQSIDNIKAYMFVAIKNKFRNHIDHRKTTSRYQNIVKGEARSFISEVVETETLSIITQALDALPAECAAVFKLHLDGWAVKDIASKLNKSESTVYAQKQSAISLLKKKLNSKYHMFLFTI